METEWLNQRLALLHATRETQTLSHPTGELALGQAERDEAARVAQRVWAQVMRALEAED